MRLCQSLKLSLSIRLLLQSGIVEDGAGKDRAASAVGARNVYGSQLRPACWCVFTSNTHAPLQNETRLSSR